MTGGPRAVLGAVIASFEQSQWASAADLQAAQLRQLERLARHCAANSVHFAQRLTRASLAAVDLGVRGGLLRLPILTRREVQVAGDDLFCTRIPVEHQPVGEGKTSGSTGEPVVVLRTGYTRLIFLAMTMRDLLWHHTDVRSNACAVRANVTEPIVDDDWGAPASLFGPTGRFLTLPVTADARQLVDWVREFEPASMLIYPSTLRAFVGHARDRGSALPGLRHVRTVGETLSPSIRAEAEAQLGVRVTDCYSSQELGYIALQCPVSQMYHPMVEGLIAEVLNERGEPCGEGELGRITVTDLHNFATPLIRYDIGDIAEVGPPCPCGRAFPTWRRILGRERNLLLKPDGTRHWPITGFNRCREVAPIIQYQLVQRDRHSIEARLVVERSLTAGEQERLRALFHSCVGYPFDLTLTYVDGRLAAGPSGKFEEFICAVAS